MVETLATGLAKDDAELFKKANALYASSGREPLTVDEFNNLTPELKERINKVDVNKLADMQDNLGSLDVVKKRTDVAGQRLGIEDEMLGLSLGTGEQEVFFNAPISSQSPMININNGAIRYNLGVSSQSVPANAGNSVNSNTSFNDTSIPNTSKNKNLFDRYRNKLEAMGLKAESTDPATGKSLGLQDTDPMRAVVKPMIGAIFGGAAALPAVAISWFSHGRAQQKAATEMIKDIEDGTFKKDKMYLNYSGKQLFRKMATTFADPYRQMNTIYGKAGVDGNAIRNFFDYAAENDMFDKKTLRDLQQYRPGLLASTLSAYDAAGKERPDFTFYASEFKDTLPEGSKLFSTIESGGQTIQQTYQTPTGQTISTGVQQDGIQQQPQQTSSNNQGSANQGGGGDVFIGGNQYQSSVDKNESYYKDFASSGSQFGYGLQEGGPVPVGNTEVINEPNKDMSGVADDVPRQLQEGDFVINAPAVAMAGKADILKMIQNARNSLRARGVQLTGREAGDIDVDVSNKEIVISKAEAEEIGYDRLEKINNRGKERVREIAEEQEQKQQIQQNPQPQGMMNVQNAQVGGQINLDENKNQPIAVPRESFAGQSSVGRRLLSPMSPEAQDDEAELASRSQSFEGFLKPIKMQEGDTVRADRNNNPLNLVANKNTVGFFGVTGVDDKGDQPENYLMFNDINNGLRAGAYVLRYQYNNKTPKEIINMFSRTDKEAYTRALENQFGNNKISTQDDKVLLNLMKVMINQEGSKQMFTDEQILNAINESKVEKLNPQKLQSGDKVKPQEVARDLIAKELKEELVQNMSNKQQKVTTGFLAVADTLSKIASDKILSGEFDLMGGKLQVGANPSGTQSYLGFSKTF